MIRASARASAHAGRAGRSPALAHHEAAGRLEARRLAVRHGPADAARADDGALLASRLDEGPLAPGRQRLADFDLGVAIDAQGDGARLDLTVRNAGETPVHLEAVVVGLCWPGAAAAAAAEGGLRFLRHGWQSWSFTGARPLEDAGPVAFPSGEWLRGFHHGLGRVPEDRSGWHESDLLTAVGVVGGRCCVAGVLEGGEATGVLFLRRDADDVQLEIELRTEIDLAPGEERVLDAVRVALGSDVSRLLEEHAEAHGREASALTTAPFQAGWCSWYHFFHAVSEDDLLRNLEALTALRSEIPIEVVQLDDGYQRAIGDWLETNAKFPRGLAPLAAEIRAAGFRPGIWTAPFCVVRESRVFEEHPEWLLRRGDDLQRGLLHPEWTPDAAVYVLDPSREEVRNHLMRTHAGLAGMGFRYQKLDFLWTVAAQARAQDPGVSRARRLALGLDAIRSGAGDETFLLGCGCPLGPAVGRVDGMRIGPDVAPHWHVAPDAAIPGIEPTVPSVRNAIRNVVNRAFQHRRLWLNDPDCLMVRSRETQLSPAEARSLASAIAATGGMTVFSDDVPELDESDRRLLRDTLALAREVDEASMPGSARAEGLLAEEIAPALSARTASGTVVAVWNDSEQPRELDVPLAIASGGADEPAPLLGTATARVGGGRVRAHLEPHQSSLVRTGAPPRLAVFCDFDGTFAVQDVGATIAKRHASERRPALWERLSRGELTPWQYNLELLDGLALPEAELDAFLGTVDLSPGAGDVVAWCEKHGVPFRVLSDGFDRNLDRLQDLHGVRFAYDSNRLWYEEGRWRIAAGAPDASCDCGTGVCKRARIAAFRRGAPDAVVVHVGNGRVSDLCASLAADVVFAKDTLAEELDARAIVYEPFADLRDVLAGLERLWARLGAPA